MAGDWIKMRTDLFTHPKVVRISSALKADTLRTVGGLMSVWCLFDAHSSDGTLDGYSTETLDDYLRWPGFSAAMVAVGWLIEEPESLVLPEFDTHNGQSAKRRSMDAERKREVRKASASGADKKRTREEKRREENNKTPTSSAGAQDPSDLPEETGTEKTPAMKIQRPDGEAFAIGDDWLPDDQLIARLQMAGIPTAMITKANVAEFISYWSAKGDEHTTAEWNHKFFKSLITQHRRGGNAAASSSQNYPAGPRTESGFERMQRANGINPETGKFFEDEQPEAPDGQILGAHGEGLRAEVV